MDYFFESAEYFGWFLACLLVDILPLFIWMWGYRHRNLRSIWWGLLILHLALAGSFFLAWSDQYDIHHYGSLVSGLVFSPYLAVFPFLAIYMITKRFPGLNLWMAAVFYSTLTGIIGGLANQKFDWFLPSGRGYMHSEIPHTPINEGLGLGVMVFLLLSLLIVPEVRRRSRKKKKNQANSDNFRPSEKEIL